MFVHCPLCNKVLGNLPTEPRDPWDELVKNHFADCPVRTAGERIERLELDNLALQENLGQALGRLARLEKAFAEHGIDDLLAGKFPPEGACPECGHHEVRK
jgi:hypothetical protein